MQFYLNFALRIKTELWPGSSSHVAVRKHASSQRILGDRGIGLIPTCSAAAVICLQYYLLQGSFVLIISDLIYVYV